MKMLFRLLLLLALVGAAAAQNSEPLPMMAGGEFPVYPPLARAAQIQGVVKIVVTTDGHKVTSTRVESGHPMLVKAAETSAATWRFATHTPTTFTVTYRFVLPKKYKGNPNNPTVTLRLPTEVEVAAQPTRIPDSPAAHTGTE